MVGQWHIDRVGKAASTTTPTGSPAYGTAVDLSTGNWTDASYNTFTRDMAERNAPSVLDRLGDWATRATQTFRDTELDFADAAEAGDLDEALGETWWNKTTGVVGQAAKAGLGGGGLGLTGIVSGAVNLLDDEDEYEEYDKAGGLLTREEFEAYSFGTRRLLLDRAKGDRRLKQIMDIPGAEQAVAGVEAAYRGTTTGLEVARDADREFMAADKSSMSALMRAVGDEAKFLVGKDNWSKAWRESSDKSLGNVLVDWVLQGDVSEDRLAKWRKDSGLYQASSFGTEALAAWYAAPEVLAARGVGIAGRAARGEKFLDRDSAASKALQEELRGDAPTVGGISGIAGRSRARNIKRRQAEVSDLAKTMSYGEFSSLKMFRGHTVDGSAAARALWEAANSGDKDLLDLTWRSFDGDPQAWGKIRQLNDQAPEDLLKLAGESDPQPVLDAMNSLKERANKLEVEVERLQRGIDQGNPRGFQRWDQMTTLDDKVADLAEARDGLERYRGYGAWLQNSGIEGTEARAYLARVSTAGQKAAAPRADKSRAKFFMNNQFGSAQTIFTTPKRAWEKQVNPISMHDIDSGHTAINRWFSNLDGYFGYKLDPETRESYLTRWTDAGNTNDRYRTVAEFEEKHVIAAAAHRFNQERLGRGKEPLDEDVFRRAYRESITAQNSFIRKMNEGEGVVYASGSAQAAAADAKILSRENGKVTISYMDDSGVPVTSQIPEEGWTEKFTAANSPVDPTQTPNTYNPINVREFYLTLKHNEELMEQMDRGGLAKAGAVAAEATDKFGTMFNSIWKPLTLLRLGWPQRVLMDENMRALTVLGPLDFARFYGPAYMTGATKLAANVHRRGSQVKQKLTGGRLGAVDDMDRLAREINSSRAPRQTRPFATAVARDQAVKAVPEVPESLMPKPAPDRLLRIGENINAYNEYQSKVNKRWGWQRERDRLARMNLDALAEGRTKDSARLTQQHTQFIQQAKLHGVDLVNDQAPDVPLHPLETLRTERGNNPNHRMKTQRPSAGPSLHEPHTGKISKGHTYAVPLNHLRAGMSDDWGRGVRWYEDNAELLGSHGIRLLADESGDVVPARVFDSKHGKDAAAFAEFIQRTNGETEILNFRTGKTEYVKDWNDITPVRETLERQFRSTPEVGLAEAKAPIEGDPTIFHGTQTDLPEELAPRTEVPVEHGNMIGRGFYTTVDEQIANVYGGKVYSIRSHRDGKKLRVWDADEQIRPGVADDLMRWVRENPTEDLLDDLRALRETNPDATINDVIDTEFSDLFRLLRSEDEWPFGTTVAKPGGNTWANVFEAEHWNAGAQDVLTNYLEAKHGVGAITHRGGTTRGEGHQVYVWLHPEDLEVRPAYENTGRYLNLVEHLDSPTSKDLLPDGNFVPEDRIRRTGRRNPMWREFRQLRNRAEHDGENFTPEDQARIEALGDALGMERRPTGWVQTRPARFEEMVDEARTLDMERATPEASENLGVRPDLDYEDIDRLIDHPTRWLYRQMRKRSDQGKGHMQVRDADGNVRYVPSAYEGHGGELMHALVSSNKVFDYISDGKGQALRYGRRHAVGHKTYHPPNFEDPQTMKKGSRANKEAIDYFGRWADMVNDQIAHSPIWSKMLKGQSDERIIDWLENTGDGAAVRREMTQDVQNIGEWVLRHRRMLDHYLPNPMLQRLLAKGRIQASDLRKHVHNDDLPDIFGPDLELDKLSGVGRLFDGVMRKLWHTLGTAPIDQLSRHPFARSQYELALRGEMRALKPEHATQENLDMIAERARKYALRQTKRTLWDLVDQANFTEAVRFVSPFWGAQLEAIQKWLRLTVDKPELVAGFFTAQRAAYNNFMVVDRDGNDVKVRGGGMFGAPYNPEDRVILQIPEVIRDTAWGKSLKHIGSLGIPIGSVNTVLQGENPLMPGLGPMVTIPADKFLRAFNDDIGNKFSETWLYNYLFPIGRPKQGGQGLKSLAPNTGEFWGGILEQVSPGWARRVQAVSEDGLTYHNVQTQLAREMILDAEKAGRPKPTPAEIERATVELMAIRTIASLTLPVQAEFRPKNQFFVDEYHRMQREYGAEAQDEFLNKYLEKYGPAIANFATSSTYSTAGVPSTQEGMKEWGTNKTLIAKYPEWGGAIVGEEAWDDEFSYDAYLTQTQVKLGPGETDHLREGVGTNERLRKQEVSLGWFEYRKMNSAIEAELVNRGLHSIRQSGAEDLAEIKRVASADLVDRYPAWGETYGSNNTREIYARVRELRDFAYDSEFDSRPEFKGVRQYFEIRDAVADELTRRHEQEGRSLNLDTQDNADLDELFHVAVGALKQDNPMFAEFYDRYLEKDVLGSGWY